MSGSTTTISPMPNNNPTTAASPQKAPSSSSSSKLKPSSSTTTTLDTNHLIRSTPPNSRTILLSNISPDLTLHHIKTFFQFCGKIEKMGYQDNEMIGLNLLKSTEELQGDSDTNMAPISWFETLNSLLGTNRNFRQDGATDLSSSSRDTCQLQVVFFTQHAAETACLLDRTQLLGRPIRVRRYGDEAPKSPNGSSFAATADMSKAKKMPQNIMDWIISIIDSLRIEQQIRVLEVHRAKLFETERTQGATGVSSSSPDQDSSNTKQNLNQKSIYVGNLHGLTTPEDLVSIVSICGPVRRLQWDNGQQQTTTSRSSSHFSYVQHKYKNSFELAVKILNGISYRAQTLRVSVAQKQLTADAEQNTGGEAKSSTGGGDNAEASNITNYSEIFSKVSQRILEHLEDKKKRGELEPRKDRSASGAPHRGGPSLEGKEGTRNGSGTPMEGARNIPPAHLRGPQQHRSMRRGPPLMGGPPPPPPHYHQPYPMPPYGPPPGYPPQAYMMNGPRGPRGMPGGRGPPPPGAPRGAPPSHRGSRPPQQHAAGRSNANTGSDQRPHKRPAPSGGSSNRDSSHPASKRRRT